MTTKEMIEILRYKAENIKAKIEPEFFNEVAETLERQIPKQLHRYENGTDHCPYCDYDNTALGFKVCVECGQVLDWSKDE